MASKKQIQHRTNARATANRVSDSHALGKRELCVMFPDMRKIPLPDELVKEATDDHFEDPKLDSSLVGRVLHIKDCMVCWHRTEQLLVLALCKLPFRVKFSMVQDMAKAVDQMHLENDKRIKAGRQAVAMCYDQHFDSSKILQLKFGRPPAPGEGSDWII